MALRTDLTTQSWSNYELLDSGNNRKLERFGSVILARPETQAIWKPLHPKLWHTAHAEFIWEGKKGTWKKQKDIPAAWEMRWNDVRFFVKLTSFKHTGVFPEQALNWQWMAKHLTFLDKPRVLNLFGYTGIASVVAAAQGAHVTHVDASKQSIAWAQENARLSDIPKDAIRYILEDALAFTKREVRRGVHYDGIILDPPAFGRGAKGEVWHIEEALPELMDALNALLSKKTGSFFLLNGYAAGYTPQSFLQLTKSCFEKINAEYGELQIKETKTERQISAGIYVRFVHT